MDRTKLALTVIVAAMIASIVSFFYWDAIRDTIVVPVYYLLWITDLFIKSFPQQFYLALLVLICIFVSLNALQKMRLWVADPARPRERLTDNTRYIHWKRLYEKLYSNLFFRNQFARETRDFLLSVLAYQEGLEVEQVEAMVLNGTLDVPPAVKNLVTQKEFHLPMQEVSAFQNAVKRFGRLFGLPEPKVLPQPDDQVMQVIKFIEYRLEIINAGD